MWRRVPAHLQTLVVACRSTGRIGGADSSSSGILRGLAPASLSSSLHCSPFHKTSPLFSAEAAETVSKKKVEDVMPVATGLEREELEAELEGRKRFDMDPPVGPFGTKEAPAIIQSFCDKRLVGCSGGEGEDEHDVIWFWLGKDKPYECPVCSQYFKLEVIGPGGPRDGHGDEEDH